MVTYNNQLNINCDRCFALVKSRKRITWGWGNIKSPVVFIGEAPGYLGCDVTGIPFKGDKSGNLFFDMLEHIGLKQEDVYTTNVVKCCPQGNREPTFDEITKCLPFLKRELYTINPELTVLMGKIPIQAFEPRISGVLKHWNKIIETDRRYMLLPHPAYICRNMSEKEKYIKSFELIKSIVKVEKVKQNNIQSSFLMEIK